MNRNKFKIWPILIDENTLWIADDINGIKNIFFLLGIMWLGTIKITRVH